MMQTFSKTTGISVVAANMIGTGVFTSLGFQLLGLQSPFVLMMLWLVGGVTALCGALTYAELGANLPRSGGEYNFLTRLYHPCAGFVSGWVSATVGFAAPVALAAMTFAAYLSAVFPQLPRVPTALALVSVLSLSHCFSRVASSRVQKLFTALKFALIILFCFIIFVFGNSPQAISFAPQQGDQGLIFSGAFAVALIYVNYAYTGWNAATYLTGEMDNPQRDLPMVLFLGTGIVMVLYLILNASFLSSAPIPSLKGQMEVGVIVAEHALGGNAGKIMGAVLALLLISTVSAMTMAGPRVLQMIGEDFKVFSKLAVCNAQGIPVTAILVQGAIAIFFVISATFESVLIFSSFVLAINTLFSVLGIFILRYKKLNIVGAYRTLGYPVTPSVYLAVTLWTLIYVLRESPQEGLLGLAIIGVGILIYYLSTDKPKKMHD